MTCIEYIYSVSALVGTGKCNADCSFCAGKYLRTHAIDQLQYDRSLESAIKLSARYGGWSLSLTSSGEPTCEPEYVTKALQVYHKCASQGAYFPSVVLFTNGILLADDEFCKKYLPVWRQLGLTSIAVSIHDLYRKEQAKAYGLSSYPRFEVIFNNIRRHGIGVRCTLLLRKGGIDSVARYAWSITKLQWDYRMDNITSWPIGNPDGTRNEFTISRRALWGIRLWLRRNAKLCWGGGVYDYHGGIVRLTSYVTKHNPRKDFVRQLVVFTDGTVAYSWIREGSLCLK